MKQADRGEAGGKGMAFAGLIMGIVTLVMMALGILGILFYVLLFGFVVAAETM